MNIYKVFQFKNVLNLALFFNTLSFVSLILLIIFLQTKFAQMIGVIFGLSLFCSFLSTLDANREFFQSSGNLTENEDKELNIFNWFQNMSVSNFALFFNILSFCLLALLDIFSQTEFAQIIGVMFGVTFFLAGIFTFQSNKIFYQIFCKVKK